MIWELSVALIAVAFVVLVVFLIKTLKAAEKSLDKTTQTLQEVRKTIDELSYEVKQVVRQASDITGDLQQKLNQIDPVLESVKNTGEILTEVTQAAKQVSTALIGKVKPHEEVAVRSTSKTPEERTVQSYESTYEGARVQHDQPGWMKWVDIAAGIWQKYRA